MRVFLGNITKHGPKLVTFLNQHRRHFAAACLMETHIHQGAIKANVEKLQTRRWRATCTPGDEKAARAPDGDLHDDTEQAAAKGGTAAAGVVDAGTAGIASVGAAAERVGGGPGADGKARSAVDFAGLLGRIIICIIIWIICILCVII